MFYRPRILMFCGSGYAFCEIFGPVIEEISKDCDVELLLGDYYLTDYTLDSVKRLHGEHKLTSYRVINPYSKDGSAFVYHRRMQSIVPSLHNATFDLLLLGTDFDLFDRYLIDLARSKGAIVVVIQISQLPRILYKYRKISGEGNSRKQLSVGRQINSRDLINYLMLIKKRVRNSIGIVKRNIRRSVLIIKNHYIIPLIVIKRCFPSSKYDRLNFTSGRADAVICYDPLEIEALGKTVPLVKNIYLAKHPAVGLCRCNSATNYESENKLLVALSGCIGTELEADKFNRWIRTIEGLIKLTNITEIHLRFHPRTSKQLIWPKKLAEEIKKLGAEVRVVDALEESLVDSVCNYRGILGAPSGTLRTARFACQRIFIIGLPNCGDPLPWEQEWSLGSAEGINWIREGEELEARHLRIPDYRIDDRPSVSEVLSTLLKLEKITA